MREAFSSLSRTERGQRSMTKKVSCFCARQGGHRVDFVAVVDQVIALLRQRGRVTSRILKRQVQAAVADSHVEEEEVVDVLSPVALR